MARIPRRSPRRLYRCEEFLDRHPAQPRAQCRGLGWIRAAFLRDAGALAARGESLAAFAGRCIVGGCVAPPLNTPGILGRRALPARRLARLGATPHFHHGLLAFVMASTAVSAQTVSVSGRVANAQGGIITGADVTLRSLPPPGVPVMPRMPNMPGMAGAERTTQSGADGTFSIDQVSPGQYVLQVDFSGFERSSQEVTVSNQPQSIAVTLQPLEIPGAEAAPRAGAGTAAEMEALIDRINTLEQRIADLESSTVLSEPETRPKRIEVYVDENGVESEEPFPGAKKQVTYQRERVFRRQTINEKLEQALTDQDAKKIAVGISAASVTQFAKQTRGASTIADGHAYQLASADLLFSAGLAQYTTFFADLVGLS